MLLWMVLFDFFITQQKWFLIVFHIQSKNTFYSIYINTTDYNIYYTFELVQKINLSGAHYRNDCCNVTYIKEILVDPRIWEVVGQQLLIPLPPAPGLPPPHRPKLISQTLPFTSHLSRDTFFLTKCCCRLIFKLNIQCFILCVLFCSINFLLLLLLNRHLLLS